MLSRQFHFDSYICKVVKAIIQLTDELSLESLSWDQIKTWINVSGELGHCTLHRGSKVKLGLHENKREQLPRWSTHCYKSCGTSWHLWSGQNDGRQFLNLKLFCRHTAKKGHFKVQLGSDNWRICNWLGNNSDAENITPEKWCLMMRPSSKYPSNREYQASIRNDGWCIILEIYT